MLAGALIGEAVFRSRLGRLAPIAGALAAAVPDLDVLPGWFSADRFFSLEFHRGPTHSVFMVPLLSAALAAIICAVTRRWEVRRCGWIFLACLLPMFSHPLLDWLTNYGTQLLWPFDSARYALDWIFIIDPLFLIILAGALVLTWRQLRRGKPGRGIAGRVIAFALLYVFFLGALHHMALDRLRDDFATRGLPAGTVRNLACFPVPLSPFAWNAIYTTGDETDGLDVHTAVSWVLNKSTPRFDTLHSAPSSPEISAALATPHGQVYMWFTRFPVVEQQTLPNGDAEITVFDARFRSYVPFLQRQLQRKPFLFRAEVAPDGTVRSTAFAHWK
jgi:inner membrane protein